MFFASALNFFQPRVVPHHAGYYRAPTGRRKHMSISRSHTLARSIWRRASAGRNEARSSYVAREQGNRTGGHAHIFCGDDTCEIARDLFVGQRQSRLTHGHFSFAYPGSSVGDSQRTRLTRPRVRLQGFPRASGLCRRAGRRGSCASADRRLYHDARNRWQRRRDLFGALVVRGEAVEPLAQSHTRRKDVGVEVNEVATMTPQPDSPRR